MFSKLILRFGIRNIFSFRINVSIYFSIIFVIGQEELSIWVSLFFNYGHFSLHVELDLYFICIVYRTHVVIVISYVTFFIEIDVYFIFNVKIITYLYSVAKISYQIRTANEKNRNILIETFFWLIVSVNETQNLTESLIMTTWLFVNNNMYTRVFISNDGTLGIYVAKLNFLSNFMLFGFKIITVLFHPHKWPT